MSTIIECREQRTDYRVQSSSTYPDCCVDLALSRWAAWFCLKLSPSSSSRIVVVVVVVVVAVVAIARQPNERFEPLRERQGEGGVYVL